MSARTPMVRTRRRGMGQASAPYGGIAPGSPCYDASHDGGIIHCAGFSNVLLDAIPFIGKPATTTCSDAEMQCFQNAATALASNPTDPNALAILNGGASGGAGGSEPSDACTAAVGFSCSTLAIGAAAVLALLMLAPLMTAGRRY